MFSCNRIEVFYSLITAAPLQFERLVFQGGHVWATTRPSPVRDSRVDEYHLEEKARLMGAKAGIIGWPLLGS